MDFARLSGMLMILGFSLLIVGGIAAPPGVYRENKLDEKLKIISDHQIRWSATNLIGSIGAVSTSLGFILLASHLWKSQNQILIVLGAIAASVAAIAVTVQSFRRAYDPAVQLAGTARLDQVWLWSFLLAIFLFGIILLQAGYPNWLGYLSISTAIVLGITSTVGNLAIAEVAYLIPAIVAIVLLKNS